MLRVEHKAEGFHAFCFRCGDTGWLPHPAPSLSERLAALARVKEAELQATATIDLPAPMTVDPQQWPAPARVWLYKAGLSNDDIEGLGFYYNERLKRVVMPIYQGGKLVYWQARSLERGVAKYINPAVDKAGVMPTYGSGPLTLLTEDILSAYKAGRVTQAIALMGTRLSHTLLVRLAQAGQPVGVMLDPDKAGISAAIKVRKQLINAGVDAHIVHVPRDPKLLTTQEIRACVIPLIQSSPG